jgi:uncharacterized membrane-anchored protein YhcB (DUF1043 family)
MNGYLTTALLWLAGALIAVVNVVVGFAIKQHVKSDEEFRERTDKEIDKLRTKVHELSNRVSEANTRLRWINEDKQ